MGLLVDEDESTADELGAVAICSGFSDRVFADLRVSGAD